MTNDKLRKKHEELKKERISDLENNKPVKEVRNLNRNKFFHPIVRTGFRAFSKLNKQEIIVEGSFPKTDRSVIVSPNHTRKTDIEMIKAAIPNQMILLSGDFDNIHGTPDGTILEQDGIMYLDMKDELDRKNIIEVEKQVLNAGFNILPFYEATWNLSPNEIVYDGYFSIIQTAIDTNSLVLPIAFEHPIVYKKENGKDVYEKGKKAYIKIGEPIDYRKIYGNKKLSKQEKIEGLELLKTKIATLVYELWEKHGQFKRGDLPDDFWEHYLDIIVNEWKFTKEEIDSKRFIDKDKEEALDKKEEITKTLGNNFFDKPVLNYHKF